MTLYILHSADVNFSISASTVEAIRLEAMILLNCALQVPATEKQALATNKLQVVKSNEGMIATCLN